MQVVELEDRVFRRVPTVETSLGLAVVGGRTEEVDGDGVIG